MERGESGEEDGEDWSLPADSFMKGPTGDAIPVPESKNGHQRTIVHIDVDCFYAQVEMIRNPSLRDVPLGIQQKYLVVTCNYPAQARGVTKLMGVVEAKKKCPELVLVSGEDLTHYREMSYKISDLLESDKAHSSECPCGCHFRLAVGSQIAADIRSAMNVELGVTCCAGVAHNKVLAKLASHNWPRIGRPGEVLAASYAPEGAKGERVGWASSKRLRNMGVVTVTDLQQFPLSQLEEEFGDALATTMHCLSFGRLDSAKEALVPMAMALFHKMVDTKQPFHLNLINVAFAKLEEHAVNKYIP
nr:hypothetical protein BaRGS_013472 [Batillaria attramentaria]